MATFQFKSHTPFAGLAQGYFKSIIIVPYVGKHEVHFPQLKKELGVEYEDMLFFDDEGGNIRQVWQTKHIIPKKISGWRFWRYEVPSACWC